MDGFELTRRLRQDPRTADGLDHHADRPRAFGRQARGVRDRRRRLHRQAVRHAGAARADPRRAAPRRATCAPSRRSPGCPATSGSRRRSTGGSTAARPFAILYADLDHFKAYNDHYGFMRGDQVIQATARLDRGGRPRGHGRRGVRRARRRRRLRGRGRPVDGGASSPEAIVERFDEGAARLLRRGRPRARLHRGHEPSRRAPAVPGDHDLDRDRHAPSKRGFQHYAEAVAVATEMKQFTKGATGSSWAIDRRGDRLSRSGQAGRAPPGRSPARSAPRAPAACRSSACVSIPSATIVMSISSANEIERRRERAASRGRCRCRA